jgi:hypothetical protein
MSDRPKIGDERVFLAGEWWGVVGRDFGSMNARWRCQEVQGYDGCVHIVDGIVEGAEVNGIRRAGGKITEPGVMVVARCIYVEDQLRGYSFWMVHRDE